MQRRCACGCGEVFEATRVDQEYAAPSHRQRAYRERSKAMVTAARDLASEAPTDRASVGWGAPGDGRGPQLGRTIKTVTTFQRQQEIVVRQILRGAATSGHKPDPADLEELRGYVPDDAAAALNTVAVGLAQRWQERRQRREHVAPHITNQQADGLAAMILEKVTATEPAGIDPEAIERVIRLARSGVVHNL